VNRPAVPHRVTVSVVLAFIAGLMFASFGDARQFIPGLLQGAWVTVQITVAASLLAIVASFTAAMMRLYGPAVLRWLAIGYIEVFRGTSAVVQLFWLFFVLPRFGLSLAPMVVGILALGLNIGAYGAEVIRSAIRSVPRAQWEAATALNFSRVEALRNVVLPQALIAMIPPWGNLLIELLKSTALVSMITITDLTFRAQQMNETTYKTTEIFVVVLVFYLGLATLITSFMRSLEQVATRHLPRARAR
jgi:polar amino acid transport system permease protein